MDRTLLFIINPHSGRAEIKQHLLDIIAGFTAQGWLVTVKTTSAPGQAVEIARELGGRYDRVVSAGGDGTVNEIINGLVAGGHDTPLGIIPAGTTNDYAYTLGIPFDMVKASATAGGSRIATLDLGDFNGRCFSYVAAFGLFTDVTYETPQDAKNIFGTAAYVLEGAKRILDVRDYHISIDHDSGHTEDDVIIALFSNTVSVAGLRTAFGDAKLDDGLIEITLVKSPKNLGDIQKIVNILLNFEQMSKVKSDFIRVITTTKARVISAQPIAWTVDGESAGTWTDSEIGVRRLAINVAVGDTKAVGWREENV